MAAQRGHPRKQRRDLLKVVWQLDCEHTGTVVAYWTATDEGLIYRKFVLDRSADRAELPSPVASIVQQADDAHGQWASVR